MAEIKKKSVFEVLSAIDCTEHIEKIDNKRGKTFSYLSWAWAWHIVKTNYPDAYYTIYEDENHIPYFTDGKTAWVKTGVTIDGQELMEYLPIMDFTHKSIPVDIITSFDMNTAIQRSLTKACARHGLGLYIYAGEDLPEKATETPKETPTPGYTPVSQDIYYQLIEGYSKGLYTKSGADCMSWWVSKTHAGLPERKQFAADVANYCLANGIKKPIIQTL